LAENLLIGLAGIIVFGIFVQWISWYFKLPSILLLLIFGLLAGPITGLLRPDEFFGDLLFPFVSIAVAIILFEGGLSLKISELKPVFAIVRNLITIGTVITWSLSTAAAYYFINLPFMYSLLLGAILVVTGPTVIMPLLRLVKPKGQINSILKWEGIVNDPIGAILALLAFDIIIAAGVAEATYTAILIAIKTFILSSLIGVFRGIYFSLFN
jgi:NhaP-type Na+/H+ or K+/H+ antiporter